MSSPQMIFALMFFLAFGIYLFMGIFMYQLNPKNKRNRWFSAVCFLLCCWSLGFVMANAASEYATALFWRRFAAMGWSVVHSFVLHLLLLLTREKFAQKKWYLKVLLHIPGLICLYVFALSGTIAPMQYNLVLTDYGWINVAINNGWDIFFYAYYLSYSLLGIASLMIWKRKTSDSAVQFQSRLIMGSLVVILLLGSLFDVVVSAFFESSLPQIAPIISLIPVGTVYYVLSRRRYLLEEDQEDTNLLLAEIDRDELYYYLGLAFILIGISTFLPAFLPEGLSVETVWEYRLQMSAFSFFIGFGILALKGLKREKIRDLSILFVTVASIPFFNFIFAEYSGVTLWAIPFLLMILALAFETRLPLILIMGTSVGTQLALWSVSGRIAVSRGGADYLARIALIVIAYELANRMNKIHVGKLRENMEKAELQEMISATSFDFLSINDENEAEKITQLLERSSRIFQADRAVLSHLAADGVTYTIVYEWCKDESFSQDNAQYHPQLDSKIDRDLDEVRIFSEGCNFCGTLKALASVPIADNGQIIGFLDFEFDERPRKWSNASLEALKVLGNLISDARARLKAEREIQVLAYYDGLTGLPNRTLFTDRLSQALHLAHRNAVFVGVVFMNIDAFKMVNDTMGHNYGDRLLQEVAAGLQQRLRKTDTVARFGSDEFVIMVNSIEEIQAIHNIVEKILETFSEPFVIQEQEFFITASVGAALYPVDGEDADSLIKNSTLAMRAAKAKGKNQYVLCTTYLKEEIKQNMRISNQLFRALGRGEFDLHYQPQVRVNTGEIIGLEALLRWEHPEMGMIPPAVFIPIAEKSGLINSIGEWVMLTAARQNKKWQDTGYLHVPISVNLSVVQLDDPDLVKKVANVFEQTGLEPKYFALEITENSAVKDASYTIEVFNSLRKLGISISIDDFGTEYSSLSRLKSLPIDGIKIDMHFVQSLEKSKKDQAITEIIINLAKSLGLEVLAEGVETSSQAKFLSLKDCNAAQGYYYFKPMPSEDIETMLKLKLSGIN